MICLPLTAHASYPHPIVYSMNLVTTVIEEGVWGGSLPVIVYVAILFHVLT